MVDIKNFAVVGGMSGLQKVIGARKDGIIIEDFVTKERQFIATRKTNFVLLEGISIYNDAEGVSLAQVFTDMRDLEATIPSPNDKADSPTLRIYFAQIIPNYDADRFHTSDMKKIIKWFNLLKTHDLLKEPAEEMPKNISEEIKETSHQEMPATEEKTVNENVIAADSFNKSKED